MDFAKGLLSRYGWEKGKGLGKHEDGITQAIKPKLKFDNAGIGHDSAETFTHYWWEHAFNDAANNITVCQIENDISLKTSKQFDVSTKKISSKNRKNLVFNNFLRSATTLTNEGVIVASEEVGEETEPAENAGNMTGPPMTDEELFAACGGRTAHKGARHGLGLSGKLARVEEQERKALAMMMSKVDVALCEEEETKVRKKKKSKKSSEDGTDREEDEQKKRLEEDVLEEVDENEKLSDGKKEKRKKSKKTAAACSDNEVQDGETENGAVKRKKRKKSLGGEVLQSSETENNTEKRKKSKREASTCSDNELQPTQDSETENRSEKRKKRKKSKSSEQDVLESTSEERTKELEVEADQAEAVSEKRKKKKKREVLEDEQADGNNQDSISQDADVDSSVKKVKKSKRKRGETVE